MPPLHVIESRAPGSARRRRELAAAAEADGFHIVAGWAAPLGEDRVICSGRIRTADDARRALLAAISGAGLLVVAEIDRLTLDRFVDDLRRLGRVEVDAANPTTPSTEQVTTDDRRVVALLSEGLTLEQVAQALGSSRQDVARRAAAVRRSRSSAGVAPPGR